MTFDRSDDLALALEFASDLFKNGRFELIASVDGDVAAGVRVTEVADVFVAWLRRPTHVTLTLVAIEESDTGQVVSTPIPGGVPMPANIDTSQQARWVINATDDRAFPVDASLAARASDPAVVTVVIEEATTGTASGKDELVAAFAGTLGTSTVEIFDPVNPTVVLAADTVVANPGAVAAATLGEPTIEEIPTP